MRAKFSENSFLPLYQNINERHYSIFRNNVPVISFADFASIILQYSFGNTDFTLLGTTLKSVEGNHVPTTVAASKITEDVDLDGTNEYFFQLNGVTFDTEPTVGRYYLQFSFDIGDYYSEDFFICPPRYEMQYWSDCNYKDLGYFSAGFKHILPLKQLHIYDTDKEENEVTRSNGYNGEKKIYRESTTIYKAEILGANFIKNAIDNISAHDNITLKDLTTNETWDLTSISSNNSDKSEAFALDLSFETEKQEIIDCEVAAYENAPYSDDEGAVGALVCGAFAVTIVNTAGVLTYTIANDPDVLVTAVVSWTLNGSFIGSGSSVSIGNFGTYALRVQKNNCIVTDSFTYSNVCQAMSSTFTVNSGVINGVTSNAPSTVSYLVYDSAGIEVATALPYTAVETSTHTVKVISGDCELIYSLPVRIDPPVDCDFTFAIEKSASNLLSIVNNTATGHSTEWFSVFNSNIETSVGTGDTYQILKDGLYFAKITATGCTNSQYYYFDSGSKFVGGYSDYQELILVSGVNIDVTNFTLPHPLINSDAEINDQLEVIIEGQNYQYKTTPTDIRDFSFDFPNNRIVLFFTGHTNIDVQIRRRYV